MSGALRLFGLKAFVTGASSGIGEAIARTFSQHGAQVLAVDAPATGVDSQFKGVHGITGCALDLFQPGAANSLIESVDAELGALDIVINNHDWQVGAPIRDQDEAELANLLRKIESQIASLVSVSLPHLKKSPAGRIINVGCVRSAFARDGEAACARARDVLADLTGRIAAENGKYGITANYVQPGAVMTAGSRRVYSADRELRDYCISRSAAGRLGEPIDIAKVVLFLATDDSAFVSGTGIVADGGRMPDD